MASLGSAKKAEAVQVIVRCRPMNGMERKKACGRVVDMDGKRGQIMVTNPKVRRDEPPKAFTFDSIYDWDSKQQDLYDETFSPLVDSVLQGYNGTIFAYGQTGTGKTWTMEGDRSERDLCGVIPNSFRHIFDHINRSDNEQYLVRASYLEIYQEQIRDLLSKDQDRRLELKEKPDTGIFVKDLKAFVAKNSEEIERVMTVGNKNRSVGCTDMNEHSSRSHAIFIITVECSKIGPDGEKHIHVGKLNLVDLAGSERQSKTGATGERLKEASKINLSLSTLGNVISALVDGKNAHIPYRDSKLTRLLQDSLGGNARTVMVATIGPADYNYDETITTLRYANRAKNIKNKPKINEDPKDALIREYQDEIEQLRAELEKRNIKGGRKGRKKKASRSLDGGAGAEDEEGSEEEEEATDYGDEESRQFAIEQLKEQQRVIDAEKKALMDDHEMIAEEKDKLLAKLQKRSKQVHKEQDTIRKLSKTIQAMEGKLLVGDKTIHAHTKDQERELERKRRQIAEEKRREREIQQELEAKEESTAEVQETFSNLQQEVMAKTKKLNTLFGKFQVATQELEDLTEAFADDRMELMQSLEDLTRDIRQKELILDNFIPEDVRMRLTSRAEWDSDEDEWVLAEVEERATDTLLPRPMGLPRASGRSKPGRRRSPGRSMVAPGSRRYRPENILQVDLDLATRTTQDYEGPVVAPRLQAKIEAALEEGSEMVTIDASVVSQAASAAAYDMDRASKVKKKKKAGQKKATGKTSRAASAAKSPESAFPQVRGLVANTPRFM